MGLIANLTTAAGDTPTSQTNTNATAAAGPNMDVVGMIAGALEDAKELNNKITLIQTVVDGSDPIHTALASALGQF